VKLDCSHLDAGQQSRDIFDIEIILDPAVLFGDRNPFHMFAKAARVMFLEEALLRPALRTAHQADGAMGCPRQHQCADMLVIIGQIAFGGLGIGEYDAIPA